MQDRLACNCHLYICAKIVAGVWVPVPPWETARCDLKAYAVAGHEDVAGRPQVDDVKIGPARLDQRRFFALAQMAIARPYDAVGEIDRATVRKNVCESSHKVRIRCR